jgi:4-methyl-5(b-hydroxyethyl)-thiazole monophosphate biosynthesis
MVYVMQRSKKGRIFILVAPGFEEADVSAVTRTLRRSGLPVAVVGLAAGPIRGNYGLALKPDVILSETEPEFPSAVVLPGGSQGAQRLNAEPRVHTLLRQVIGQGGYVMALDAAYMVLRSSGVLDGVEEWPAEMPFPDWCGEGALSERVTVEGPIIFGRDSGAAQEKVRAQILLAGNREGYSTNADDDVRTAVQTEELAFETQ